MCIRICVYVCMCTYVYMYICICVYIRANTGVDAHATQLAYV